VASVQALPMTEQWRSKHLDRSLYWYFPAKMAAISGPKEITAIYGKSPVEPSEGGYQAI
jgi:hypothetical protein